SEAAAVMPQLTVTGAAAAVASSAATADRSQVIAGGVASTSYAVLVWVNWMETVLPPLIVSNVDDDANAWSSRVSPGATETPGVVLVTPDDTVAITVDPLSTARNCCVPLVSVNVPRNSTVPVAIASITRASFVMTVAGNPDRVVQPVTLCHVLFGA